MTNHTESKPLVRLTRLIPLSDICVFGVLEEAVLEDVRGHLAYTLEPPWQDNEPHQSCLPAGVYDAKVYDSPTKGLVFRLNDAETKPRTAIEIHKGNVPSQTQGCILVGMKCGQLLIEGDAEPAVLDSKRALAKLLRGYSQGFTLHIEDKT